MFAREQPQWNKHRGDKRQALATLKPYIITMLQSMWMPKQSFRINNNLPNSASIKGTFMHLETGVV